MPTTELQEAVAGPPSYTVPDGGVIVSWSHYEGPPSGNMMRLKIFRRTDVPTSFFTVGQSAVESLTAGVVNTFATRIPVQAGDVLGESTLTLGADCDFSGTAGDTERGVGGDPPPGSTVTFGPPSGPTRINVAATLEPDADNDGFGDETQDACPTDETTQGACPVPETTITTGPKDKTKKKTATFEFSSDLGGATFECSLDGAAFAPCTSPDTIKVKKGKHHFEVRATAKGQNDFSPAMDDWKVKKKKR
jgi:hypothetical protein